MDSTWFIVSVVLVLLVVGFVMGLAFSRRGRAVQLKNTFGPEYDRTVQVLGDEKKAQAELAERQKHVEALNIRPLTEAERQRYLEDWTAVQAKFVDEPGQAVLDADRLITEVMLLRAYPVSDFEQRAAELSVNYPKLVNDYRAARHVADRHKENMADTEELRQAMIYYRPLFDELLKAEAAEQVKAPA